MARKDCGGEMRGPSRRNRSCEKKKKSGERRSCGGVGARGAVREGATGRSRERSGSPKGGAECVVNCTWLVLSTWEEMRDRWRSCKKSGSPKRGARSVY